MRLGRLRSKNAAFCVCVSRPAMGPKPVAINPNKRSAKHLFKHAFRGSLLVVQQHIRPTVSDVCQTSQAAVNPTFIFKIASILLFLPYQQGNNGNPTKTLSSPSQTHKSMSYTIRTSWITPHHFIFRELISVIITPPITPNNFWRFNKRNSQEKLHLLVLSLLGGSTPPITPKYSQRINWHNQFTSVTPENSRGLNCVILMGPMVLNRSRTVH